jgi:hypothetical protein
VWHGGTPPPWVELLILWESTGTPPWEIAGGNRAYWFVRWRFWYAQRVKKENQPHANE